jgi:anaerobic magnesium-protoporphyrin IX monomethyl ester cyclase
VKNDSVLLVYPRTGADARNVSLHPPLALLYLAAVLQNEYQVTIFDERTDPPEMFEQLLDQQPVCVGFSLFTGPQIRSALQLAQRAKNKNLTTVFGGIHPTILPEQTHQHPLVDYVVAGEGEYAFAQLIRSLQKNETIPPVVYGNNGHLPDLDKLPPLPYELVNIENYLHTAALKGRALPFLASRGCPYQCTFCCNPALGRGQWRTMSAAAAARQMDGLVEKYQLDALFFVDENLSVNSKILNQLAQHIGGRYHWGIQARADSLLKYDLKFLEKTGARHFGIGLESGSDKILEQIKKGETIEEFIEVNRRLARTNIETWYNYITGFPGETLEDLKATLDLSLKMLDENPHAINNTFYLLTPYPGTEIGEMLKHEMPNELAGWSEFGRHNYSAKWHAPEMMKIYQRLGFSSKFTGRKLNRLFPEDNDLTQLAKTMTDKWRQFDLFDDDQWQQLTDKGWQILKRLFGPHAY